jgi:hypothetical protein
VTPLGDDVRNHLLAWAGLQKLGPKTVLCPRAPPRNSCQLPDEGWDESCAFYSTTGPSYWPKWPT